MRGTRGRWKFTALLAPLGVPTSDGRVLARSGRFQPSLFPFLTRPPTVHGAVQLGIVWGLDVIGGHLPSAGPHLVASGVVWSGDLAADMAEETVWPEMSLIDVAAQRQPDNTLLITRGTVGAVIAGRKPAWPGIRFILEES